MILKTNLHFHTSADDGKGVDYDIYQALDFAQKKGFDVLAYTSHKKFLFKQEYADYAARKGILLVAGMEKKIEGKEILLINCGEEAEEIKNFEDLAAYKNKETEVFVIAPHPFVWSFKSLLSKLLKNIDLFDAVEMTVFSNKIFNFNKKAAEIAAKYKKPFIANSDSHALKDFDRGYSLVEAEQKTIESVLSAVKKGKFRNEMNSMDLPAMLKIQIRFNFYRILNLAAPWLVEILTKKSRNKAYGKIT